MYYDLHGHVRVGRGSVFFNSAQPTDIQIQLNHIYLIQHASHQTAKNRLSVFGAMQTAQCKRRNASGLGLEGLGLGLGSGLGLGFAICVAPLALRHLHCAVCIAPNTESPKNNRPTCGWIILMYFLYWPPLSNVRFSVLTMSLLIRQVRQIQVQPEVPSEQFQYIPISQHAAENDPSPCTRRKKSGAITVPSWQFVEAARR